MEQFKPIEKSIEDINSKFDYFINFIEPYTDLFQKYEIFAILGVFFTTFITILQKILSSISTIISIDTLNILLFLIILIAFIIYPFWSEKRKSQILSKISEMEKTLSIHLDTLKFCHYIILNE